ncbi:DUF4257 domain-containing protein [Lentibacillus sp. N15]|uniref:DUF4257 domain-containing protein n=1 Tax=Lentibacillus songyuanensis TaxID=3136161 RepID=UPI0031BAC859
MLITLTTSVLIGFFMGILRHSSKYKHIKLPKRNKASWNPGFLKDGLWGGIASLVAVLVASPIEFERIILLSILAGYVGESFIENIALRSLENEKYNKINDTVSSLEKMLNDKSDKDNKK